MPPLPRRDAPSGDADALMYLVENKRVGEEMSAAEQYNEREHVGLREASKAKIARIVEHMEPYAGIDTAIAVSAIPKDEGGQQGGVSNVDIDGNNTL